MDTTCTKCKVTKDQAEFYKRKGNDRATARYMSECKDCHKEDQRKRNACPERKAAKRDQNLRKNYGITSYDYDRMYAEQDGRCFVCEDQKSVLHVDHNHETGEVRKLLCALCNTAFGKMRESPRLINKLLEYGRMYGKAES